MSLLDIVSESLIWWRAAVSRILDVAYDRRHPRQMSIKLFIGNYLVWSGTRHWNLLPNFRLSEETKAPGLCQMRDRQIR